MPGSSRCAQRPQERSRPSAGAGTPPPAPGRAEMLQHHGAGGHNPAHNPSSPSSSSSSLSSIPRPLGDSRPRDARGSWRSAGPEPRGPGPAETPGLAEVRPRLRRWSGVPHRFWGYLGRAEGARPPPWPPHPLGRAVVGNGVAGAAQGMRASGAKVALQALSEWIPKEPLITKARRDN